MTEDDENHNLIPDDLSNYKVVRTGNLVINKMKAWQGSMGIAPMDGVVSPAYYVFAVAAGESRYLHELLRSKTYTAFFSQASDGVRVGQWDLSIPRMRRIPVWLPPADEQAAIVRFIDHADRLMRRYISVKQYLIKLLEEERQVVIQDAVTRAIDPSGTHKPSGVESLGDVPEHWHIARLKTLVKGIDQGVSPQAENYQADQASWGVLKAGCVNHGVFREREHKRLPVEFAIDPRLVVRLGDVLVSRASGSPHLVGSAGRVHSLTYKLILSDKTFRLALTDQVDPDFMVLAMNGRYYRRQVEQAISGAEGLANNLPLSSLKTFVFSVPPVGEQRQIVARLQVALSNTQEATERAERQVALVQEFRTRLLSDVVTGKLDVREAAANLSEATEDAPDESDLAEVDEVDEADFAIGLATDDKDAA